MENLSVKNLFQILVKQIVLNVTKSYLMIWKSKDQPIYVFLDDSREIEVYKVLFKPITLVEDDLYESFP